LNQSCQTLLNPDGSGVFVVRRVPHNSSPAPPFSQDHNGHPLWLLDYSVVRTGTVIPQARWYPENVNDYRQHVAEATLQMPIHFVQQNGVLGLSLDDAINGRCQTLLNPRAQAQLGGKTTTHIRIAVCIHWPTCVSLYIIYSRRCSVYNISGLDTTNSSAKSRSETRHPQEIRSPLQSLLITSVALWRPSFGSVFRC
jgi:hypothetical protein